MSSNLTISTNAAYGGNDVSASGNDGMINDDIEDKDYSETSHHIIISKASSSFGFAAYGGNDVSASGNDGMINGDIEDKDYSETSHHIIISVASSYHHFGSSPMAAMMFPQAEMMV